MTKDVVYNPMKIQKEILHRISSYELIKILAFKVKRLFLGYQYKVNRLTVIMQTKKYIIKHTKKRGVFLINSYRAKTHKYPDKDLLSNLQSLTSHQTIFCTR
ncbi:hypothetical protein D0T56_04345 [Dysgonomonas sp. 520]|nr:hypothetical protein [Dysgonomonas sp. 520]